MRSKILIQFILYFTNGLLISLYLDELYITNIIGLLILSIIFTMISFRTIKHETSYNLVVFFLFKIIIFLLVLLLTKIFTNTFYEFAFFDDENYRNYAIGLTEISNKNSIYFDFLRFIYSIFGGFSTTGRVINLFLFSMCIPIFIYIENVIFKKKDTSFLTLIFIIFSPLSYLSIYEIKDIAILFLFLTVIRLIVQAMDQKRFSILVIPIVVLLENLRVGLGISLGALYLYLYTVNLKPLLKIPMAITALLFGFFYVSINFDSFNLILSRYSVWIITQVDESRLMRVLLIQDFSDLYKLPFAFMYHYINPLFHTSNGRFAFDVLPFIKMFENGLVLFGFFGLYKLLFSKWKVLLLTVLFFSLIIVIFNISNFRQGLYFTPFIYFGFGQVYYNEKRKKMLLPIIVIISLFFIVSTLFLGGSL